MSNTFTVCVGFSRPKKWKIFAWLIMLFEGTDFSHTYVTWRNSRIDRRKVFEAVGGGTRSIKNTTFRSHNEVVDLYEFTITTDSEKAEIEIEQYVTDIVGTKYSIKHLMGLAYMRAMNFMCKVIHAKKRYGNPFKDGKYSQICVEAGADLVQKILKIKLPGNIEDLGLVEYHDLISKLGKKVSKERLDRINSLKIN